MLIKHDGNEYEIEPRETVLDCLIRHGVPAPFSCRSGVCHTCMMRAVQGEPSAESQKGIKASRVEQNYFLPCSCVPDQDLTVVFPDTASMSSKTEVLSIDALTTEIVRLRLKRPNDFSYRAGQYTTLYNSDGVARNYSLASLPTEEDFLEFHVRRMPGGLISRWIFETLRPGDEVDIGESIGDCFYVPGDRQQPILLIGTGTGLAPLYGVLRDAIHQGHQGDIHLYHGSGSMAGLYFIERFKAMQVAGQIHYVPSVSRVTPHKGISVGRANELALADHPDLKGWLVYICGNPSLVKAAQRGAFLAGASMKDIYTDAFVVS